MTKFVTDLLGETVQITLGNPPKDVHNIRQMKSFPRDQTPWCYLGHYGSIRGVSTDGDDINVIVELSAISIYAGQLVKLPLTHVTVTYTEPRE